MKRAKHIGYSGKCVKDSVGGKLVNEARLREDPTYNPPKRLHGRSCQKMYLLQPCTPIRKALSATKWKNCHRPPCSTLGPSHEAQTTAVSKTCVQTHPKSRHPVLSTTPSEDRRQSNRRLILCGSKDKHYLSRIAHRRRYARFRCTVGLIIRECPAQSSSNCTRFIRRRLNWPTPL